MFKINVNQQLDLEIDKKGPRFFLNNQEQFIDLIRTGENSFHLIKNQKCFAVEVVRIDRIEKIFTFRVNGNEYNITLKDSSDILLNKLGINTASAGVSTDIKAPMPGLILQILVSEGSEVKKGDPLLILEAMKMENILKSPRDGMIKSILATIGKSVEKNQILVKF